MNNCEKSQWPAACPNGETAAPPSTPTLNSNSAEVHQLIDEEITDERVEKRFFELLEGQEVLVGTGAIPDKAPHWYDESKFRRGQQFFRRHFAGVSLAHFVGLIASLSSAQILKPLIFTQRSETPAKSFRRYVATIVHVACWYLGNVWEKGNAARKSVQLVRDMHSHVARMTNSAQHQRTVDRVTINQCGPKFYSEDTTFLSDVGRDTSHVTECPYASRRSDCRHFDSVRSNPANVSDHPGTMYYLNQFDMAEIQFYFVGVLILNPGKFGAVHATDEDLSGFVHFWRCIGHLLGIQDRFNFCHEDDLQFTRRLSQFYWDKLVKPSLKHVTIEYEHMGRAIAQGAHSYHPGMTFESIFVYTAFAIELDVPNIRRQMSWAQWFHYVYLRLFFCWLCWIPGVTRLLNFLMRFAIGLMVARPKWWPRHWNPPVVEGLAKYWLS